MKRLLLAFLLLLAPTLAQAASCTSYPFTLQNNTTADATQVMSNFNTVRNCVINNAAGSGVNTDITSLTALSTPLSVPQGGTPVFIGTTSTGSSNAQAVTALNPIGFTKTNGFRVTFTAGFSNNSAATFDINATGITAVNRIGFSGLEPLTGGEIIAGNILEAIYNGSVYILLNRPLPDFGLAASLAGAATTELGSLGTHNGLITGSGAVITSFGTTATVTNPIYYIKFSGANTLTYNATSLLIPGLGNITTGIGDSATVEYLGSGNWQVIQYTRSSGGGIVSTTPLCGAVGLTIKNNAGTPSTQIDVAADQLVMIIPTSNIPIYRTAVSFTINLTNTNVVNGSDGARPTSNWTNIYAIDNGTAAGGYASTNAAGSFSTTPSGYTYRCRLGAMFLDGSQNLLRTFQSGAKTIYTPVAATNTATWPLIFAGATGTYSANVAPMTAWTNTAVTSFVPPTATDISIIMVSKVGALNTAEIAATTNSAAGGSESTIPAECSYTGATTTVNWQWASQCELKFYTGSQNLFIVSGANGGSFAAKGWSDKVNAN